MVPAPELSKDTITPVIGTSSVLLVLLFLIVLFLLDLRMNNNININATNSKSPPIAEILAIKVILVEDVEEDLTKSPPPAL